MEKNIRQRLVLLLIIPFLVSYIINLLITIGFKTGLDILMSIANISLYLWAFVAAFFWFYVGKQFGKLEMPSPVLWWIPAGHIPTVEEAKERVQYLAENDVSPYAFNFKKRFSSAEWEAFALRMKA